jgi:hypothetical protein
MASLNAAKDKLRADRDALETIGEQVKALVDARRAAVEQAKTDFKAALEAAKDDLKAALGEPDDENGEE